MSESERVFRLFDEKPESFRLAGHGRPAPPPIIFVRDHSVKYLLYEAEYPPKNGSRPKLPVEQTSTMDSGDSGSQHHPTDETK